VGADSIPIVEDVKSVARSPWQKRWLSVKILVKLEKLQSWEGVLYYEDNDTGSRDDAKMCNDRGREVVWLKVGSIFPLKWQEG
jgi:hypothetical protein